MKMGDENVYRCCFSVLDGNWCLGMTDCRVSRNLVLVSCEILFPHKSNLLSVAQDKLLLLDKCDRKMI